MKRASSPRHLASREWEFAAHSLDEIAVPERAGPRTATIVPDRCENTRPHLRRGHRSDGLGASPHRERRRRKSHRHRDRPMHVQIAWRCTLYCAASECFMSALKNVRHERFAKQIARGVNSAEALRLAGFSAKSRDPEAAAARLLATAGIAQRIAEIKAQDGTANQPRVEVTSEATLRELEEARKLAIARKQPAAAISATMAKAKLAGLVVDKTEGEAHATFDIYRDRSRSGAPHRLPALPCDAQNLPARAIIEQTPSRYCRSPGTRTRRKRARRRLQSQNRKQRISPGCRTPVRRPTPISRKADELFYGGQAGGGKTDLGLGLALTAHRRSLIFRRINKDALKLVERVAEILGDADSYNGQVQRWKRPRQEAGTPRTIEFSGCEHEDDKQRFKGDPHDLIYFDEGTDFLAFAISLHHRLEPLGRPGTALPRRARLEPADHAGRALGGPALGALARSFASAPGAPR